MPKRNCCSDDEEGKDNESLQRCGETDRSVFVLYAQDSTAHAAQVMRDSGFSYAACG
jgi:hypothetical protein